MSSPSSFGAIKSMRRTGEGQSSRLTFATLESIPGMAHAFSLRNSTPESVIEAAMSGETPLHLLRQVHGAEVRVAGERGAAGSADHLISEGDALITDQSGVAIGVRVADCVPILVCDPVRRAIAAVHAGWRGTVAGVLAATLDKMIGRYRSSASDLLIAVGPAIGQCCFEVGDEVIDALLVSDPGASECVRNDGRRSFVDLIQANRRQALAGGVPAAGIVSADLCTVCHPEMFWSYRRERSAAGRMLACIGWKI